MLRQNIAYFVVKPVFDGNLFHHLGAHARNHRFRRFQFNLISFDEALHNFRSHVGDIVPINEHSDRYLPEKCEDISLLAAPKECNSRRRIEESPKRKTGGRGGRPSRCCVESSAATIANRRGGASESDGRRPGWRWDPAAACLFAAVRCGFGGSVFLADYPAPCART